MYSAIYVIGNSLKQCSLMKQRPGDTSTYRLGALYYTTHIFHRAHLLGSNRHNPGFKPLALNLIHYLAVVIGIVG